MREKSLDSLRGIAALIVVFHHAALCFPGGGEFRPELLRDGYSAPNAWLYLTPLRLLVAGPAAVLVFFVLSGLVVSLSLIEKPDTSTMAFIAKRVCRIWLPFAVAILGSSALSLLVYRGPLPEASLFLSDSWKPGSPSLSGVFQHLAMFGTHQDLDSPMWSLVHEMRISIIFPVLVMATTWNWGIVLAASAALMIASVELIQKLHLTGLAASMLTTTSYLFLFVVGIALAYSLAPIRHRIARGGPLVHCVLWIVALVLLVTAPERTDVIGSVRTALHLFSSGAGATMIVLLCAVEGRVFQALLGRVPQYLGKISYSLYLTHVIVMVTVVRALHGIATLPVAVALSVVPSIPVAHLFQKYVEAPAGKIGHRAAYFIELRRRPRSASGL